MTTIDKRRVSGKQLDWCSKQGIAFTKRTAHMPLSALKLACRLTAYSVHAGSRTKAERAEQTMPRARAQPLANRGKKLLQE